MANTIYTLRTKNVGALEHLNGKMFTIEFDTFGYMTLVDVTTGQWLRKTTSIVETRLTENGVIYTTKSGQVYDLLSVRALLPSIQEVKSTLFEKVVDDVLEELPFDDIELPQAEEAEELAEVENVAEAEEVEEVEETVETVETVEIDDLPDVLGKNKVYRAIDYGDGYSGTVYRFDGTVTYEQFTRFCKAKELEIPRKEGYAWYEDYPMIMAKSLINGARIACHEKASETDESSVWTWLWVRAYTD